MLIKIWLPEDYYGAEESKSRRRKSVDIFPGFTTLVGPNGAGKTTYLHQIRDFCKEMKYPVIYYDNLSDGGQNSMSAALWSGRNSFLANLATSSEGENIVQNLGEFAQKVGSTMYRQRNKPEPVFILLDGLDSGLSIDRLLQVKAQFVNFILDIENEQSAHDTYIISTANNYELVVGSTAINVLTGKPISLKTYNAFRKFILKNCKEDIGRDEKALSEAKELKSRSTESTD